MVVLTLDPRKAIRPDIVEGIVNKKLEQNLDFKDLFPVVPTDATSFTYAKDTTTAGADISAGTQGIPLDMTELTDLTTIKVSPITLEMGTLARFGYSLEISQRDLRTKPFIDELARAYDRAAFGIAKKINDDTLSKIIGTANDITEVNGAAAWSEPDANPISDVLKFCKAFELEGYNYQLNRLYLHKDNFYEALDYMQQLDRTFGIDPTTGAARNLPPINGVSLFNTKSTQLAEGSYVGFDSRYPCATIYKYTDPKFSSNPLDSRINVNRYEEQKYPHNIVIEIFAEMGVAVKLPNAFCYKSGAI